MPTSVLTSTITYGQTDSDLKGKPKTLDETYAYLDEVFDDITKYGFIKLPEDVSITRFYGLKEFLWND